MGVVVRRYIDFHIILLIPTPLVLALFCSSISTSLFIFKCFFILVYVIFVQYSKGCSKKIRNHSKIEITLTWRYKYMDKNVYTYVDCKRAQVPKLPGARYSVTFQESCS